MPFAPKAPAKILVKKTLDFSLTPGTTSNTYLQTSVRGSLFTRHLKFTFTKSYDFIDVIRS